MSNTIGGFQTQNGPVPVPVSAAPAPGMPKANAWEVGTALGLTGAMVAVAGGVIAHTKASKPSNTAQSFLGHDSIAAPREARTSSDKNSSQSPINAQQAKPNQPDANAPAPGVSAPFPVRPEGDAAKGNLAEPDGGRVGRHDLHRTQGPHRRGAQNIRFDPFQDDPTDDGWDRVPATPISWESPFRIGLADLHQLLNSFHNIHPMIQRWSESNFANGDLNEDDYLANLDGLDGTHPMVLAQYLALQFIEENNRRGTPNNHLTVHEHDPADEALKRILVAPSWEDLFGNESGKRPEPANSGAGLDPMKPSAPIAHTRPASEPATASEQRIHSFRLWRATGQIKAFEEVTNWKNRNQRSWREALIHARHILHDAHEPAIGENGKPTEEFSHPLLRMSNELWMEVDPSPAENKDLLRQLHENIGYYMGLWQFTKVDRQSIPSEIDFEQGLGQWLSRYRSVLEQQKETWPAAGSLLAGSLADLSHHALYKGLYDAEADRDLGATDARKIAEATQPPQVAAAQTTQNRAADMEYDAQRLVSIEQNLRMDPDFVLDAVCQYDLDFLRARRTRSPEFADAVRKAEARATSADRPPHVTHRFL